MAASNKRSLAAMAWNQKNRAQYNANGRAWYARPRNGETKRLRERARAYAKYGITVADYEQLLSDQNGVCAICKRPERSLLHSGVLRTLAVDHCHVTGKIRGLLCASCNRGLAKFGDEPIWLREAALYLERASDESLNALEPRWRIITTLSSSASDATYTNS